MNSYVLSIVHIAVPEALRGARQLPVEVGFPIVVGLGTPVVSVLVIERELVTVSLVVEGDPDIPFKLSQRRRAGARTRSRTPNRTPLRLPSGRECTCSTRKQTCNRSRPLREE